MGCSPPGSSVHGVFKQEHWSELPFPSPGVFPDSKIEPLSLMNPALAGRFFNTWDALFFFKKTLLLKGSCG